MQHSVFFYVPPVFSQAGQKDGCGLDLPPPATQTDTPALKKCKSRPPPLKSTGGSVDKWVSEWQISSVLVLYVLLRTRLEGNDTVTHCLCILCHLYHRCVLLPTCRFLLSLSLCLKSDVRHIFRGASSRAAWVQAGWRTALAQPAEPGHVSPGNTRQLPKEKKLHRCVGLWSSQLCVHFPVVLQMSVNMFIVYLRSWLRAQRRFTNPRLFTFYFLRNAVLSLYTFMVSAPLSEKLFFWLFGVFCLSSVRLCYDMYLKSCSV